MKFSEAASNAAHVIKDGYHVALGAAAVGVINSSIKHRQPYTFVDS